MFEDVRPTDAVGIPWYKRADYPRIVQVMADPELLPETFDKWQFKAEKMEALFRREGRNPIRVPLDPEKFVAWCARYGCDVDAAGRRAFAADFENWPGTKH